VPSGSILCLLRACAEIGDWPEIAMQKYPNSVQGKPLVRGRPLPGSAGGLVATRLRSCWQSSFCKSVIIYGRW
jgi:hypothetical protein